MDLFWTLKEEWRDHARNAFSCWTKLGLDGYVTIILSILDLGNACGIISDHTSSLLMSNWPRNWLLIKIWEIELQEIVIQSLKIAKEINECIDWGRDENELDPENCNISEAQWTPHLWSYPFSLISVIYFYEQIPHSHLQFCNLFSVIYFQSFNSSIYFSVIYIPAILCFATLNPNFGFAQLEHSSN